MLIPIHPTLDLAQSKSTVYKPTHFAQTSKPLPTNGFFLPHNLLVNQLLQLLLAQVVLVLVKVKELLGDWRRGRLVLGVVVRLEVWVLERLLDGDALDGVEGQQLLEEVESHVGRVGEERAEGHLLLEGKRSDVLARASGLDAIIILHCWRAEDVEDEGKLVVVWERGVSHDSGARGERSREHKSTYSPCLGTGACR